MTVVVTQCRANKKSIELLRASRNHGRAMAATKMSPLRLYRSILTTQPRALDGTRVVATTATSMRL